MADFVYKSAIFFSAAWKKVRLKATDRLIYSFNVVVMPKVVREDIDNLNTVLTVTIEKSEYEDQFKNELNKYRKQVQMKGFRKGKTPLSVLRKMYGKAVLSDVINGMLQTEVGNFLSDNDLNYLGQPLPNDEQQVYEFDPRDLEDFEFKFDLGLAPDFEVEGLGENASFEMYDVSIPGEKIDEELASARKRLGKQMPVEGDMEDGDLIKLSIKELDGDTPKEDGIEHEFSVPADRLTDAAKDTISSYKTGDAFPINIYELEKETSREYVHNYFLNTTGEEAEAVGDTVQATIVEITRHQDAEMDEAFFQQLFGDEEITTEEAAKEKLEADLKSYYDRQAEAVLFRHIQEYILEKNSMDLPEDFLKRWLKTNNENVTDDQIERDFPDFLENLKWTLIRSKLAKKHDVQISQDEIKEAFKRQIRGMISNPAMFDDNFLETMALRMMEKEEDVDRVAQQVLTDKVFEAVKESVQVEPKAIGTDDFEQIIKDINEADRAKDLARQAAAGAEEE